MLTLPIQIGKKYVRRDGVVVPVTSAISTKIVVAKLDERNYYSLGDTGVSCTAGGVRSYECFDLIADAEEKPAGHPHAALMLLYAQDWAETDSPWLRWQCANNQGDWLTLETHPLWNAESQYRRKPRTIKIGDCEIQAPERVAPAVRSRYWIPQISWRDELFEENEWRVDDDEFNHRHLKRGLVHLTPEAAEAHARALIALTALK